MLRSWVLSLLFLPTCLIAASEPFPSQVLPVPIELFEMERVHPQPVGGWEFAGGKLTSGLVLPALYLTTSHFLLAALYKTVTPALLSPVNAGIGLTALTTAWNILGQGITADFWPSLVEIPLLALSEKNARAAMMLGHFHAFSRLYGAFSTLRPELARQYAAWRSMNARPIPMGGAKKGVRVLLENNLTDSGAEPELGPVRLTLRWEGGKPCLSETSVGHALCRLVNRTPIGMDSTLSLYPVENDEGLSLNWQLSEGGQSEPVNTLTLANSKGFRWWTQVMPTDSERNSVLADPLSAAVLEAVVLESIAWDGDINIDVDRNIAPEKWQVLHQHHKNLSVLTGGDHFNIWMFPGESGLLTANQNVLPSIVIQDSEPWEHDLASLSDYIQSNPDIPGWSRPIWTIFRMALFWELQRLGWRAGEAAGERAGDLLKRVMDGEFITVTYTYTYNGKTYEGPYPHKSKPSANARRASADYARLKTNHPRSKEGKIHREYYSFFKDFRTAFEEDLLGDSFFFNMFNQGGSGAARTEPTLEGSANRKSFIARYNTLLEPYPDLKGFYCEPSESMDAVKQKIKKLFVLVDPDEDLDKRFEGLFDQIHPGYQKFTNSPNM